MEYVPIWAIFQGFEPLFRSLDPDPDPNHADKSDPHQTKLRIRIRVQDPHPRDADPQLINSYTSYNEFSFDTDLD